MDQGTLVADAGTQTDSAPQFCGVADHFFMTDIDVGCLGYVGKYIKTFNPNLNLRDEGCKTSLIWAASKGHTKVANLLLENRLTQM